MEQVQHSFERYEKKYLLTPAQYEALLPRLRERMTEDEYGMYTICNIYYDTEDYSLIRTSLSRPAYKEKFRLRSYGVPGERSLVFAEIKKKFDGVVYKRRVEGEPETIQAFVDQGKSLPADSQIQREITCFLKRYHPEPRVFIAYERLALAGKEEDLRITFDRNIRWRDRELDLRAGDQGSPVLADDGIVMEIKVPSAFPVWLASCLSVLEIYPTSFSKYGTCYRTCILPQKLKKVRTQTC